MPTPFLVTRTMDAVTGMAEDRVVNTFPMQFTGAGAPTAADFLNVAVAVDSFYNAINATQTLANYIGSQVSRAADAAVTKIYDLTGHLDGSPHGPPVYELLGATGPISGTATSLPSEVASVLTTRAAGWENALVEGPGLTRPQQRLSGRVYIGPLTVEASTFVDGLVRVGGNFRQDLLTAAERFYDLLLADGWQHSVWSRASIGIVEITDYQVDNAFDTQRRRGPDASLRDTRAVA